METSQQKHAARRVLIVILYIIAGLVLVIGLILIDLFFQCPQYHSDLYISPGPISRLERHYQPG